MKRRETGLLGERIAADFLREKGYRIVSANYHCRYGEIDIIAADSDSLVFVEVRARRSRSFGTPEESVVARKMEKLLLSAETYLQGLEAPPASWRIDVIAIELEGSNRATRIEHYQNAVGEQPFRDGSRF